MMAKKKTDQVIRVILRHADHLECLYKITIRRHPIKGKMILGEIPRLKNSLIGGNTKDLKSYDYHFNYYYDNDYHHTIRLNYEDGTTKITATQSEVKISIKNDSERVLISRENPSFTDIQNSILRNVAEQLHNFCHNVPGMKSAIREKFIAFRLEIPEQPLANFEDRNIVTPTNVDTENDIVIDGRTYNGVRLEISSEICHEDFPVPTEADLMSVVRTILLHDKRYLCVRLTLIGKNNPVYKTFLTGGLSERNIIVPP